MNMKEAVTSVYSKYATFSGRSRRSECWWFVLFYLIVSAILQIIDRAVFGTATGPVGGPPQQVSIFAAIFSLVSLLPNLAVGARRLHDIGKSGWWLLLGLIPIIGTIILIVWFAKDSDAETNAYGAPPGA